MQGVLHQVLGVAPLQVGVRQEVAGLLAALVEAVGVADQQAAVVARPHQKKSSIPFLFSYFRQSAN